jgi:aspartate ammonia-lyase
VTTALTPLIGDAAAAALAKTALLIGHGVADLVVEAGLMSREQVAKQLSPARLSGSETVTAAIPVQQASEDVGVEQTAESRRLLPDGRFDLANERLGGDGRLRRTARAPGTLWL